MISEQEINSKVEELQLLEHNLQNFLVQKQTIQVELNEIENALEELKSSDEEVYKVSSGIMVKSTKERLNKELNEKKKILEIKIKSIENQEKLLEKKSLELRGEIDKIISKETKNRKTTI